MRIITVEALDKAGKHTATEYMEEYLESKGLKVASISHPRYDTPIGELVRDWLTGKLDVCEKTFELLQAADKQQTTHFIKSCEENDVDVLIIDRYWLSQLAYGAYSNDMRWLLNITQYIRIPDAVVYLDVEPQVSMHRRGKYGDNDCYESDIERLSSTRDVYKRLLLTDIIEEVVFVDANRPIPLVKLDVLSHVDKLCDKWFSLQV